MDYAPYTDFQDPNLGELVWGFAGLHAFKREIFQRWYVSTTGSLLRRSSRMAFRLVLEANHA